MDTKKIGRGEMIAAVSALALLLIMFIFSWFGYSEPGAEIGGFDGRNAWGSFGFIDIILFVTVVIAIGLAVMTANSQSANLPIAGSALVAGLGILCVILILFRIISPPDFGIGDLAAAAGEDAPDNGRKIGVWLGLIAAAGIAVGGFLGMQEEGTSFREQGDRLQNRGPADPPPPPPPSNPPAV